MTQEDQAPAPIQGLVLFTDGGCRPNPGPAGWGMHGYLYRNEPPKKPAGVPDHVVTKKGYVSKADAITKGKEVQEELGVSDAPKATPPGGKERRAFDRVIEVTPVHYVDGYGSLQHTGSPHGVVTNNVAELEAGIAGLRHALEYDVKEVQIFTDSEYVCKGIEKWVEGWQKNGWRKADMTAPANVELWKQLVEAKDRLTQRGVEVKFSWVRGHTKVGDAVFHLGNNMADVLATIGVMASRRDNQTRTVIETTAAEGYWKYDTEKHPMISHRRMYFNTVAGFLRPGEYFLGDHGKDDDLLGKRISDGAYAVIQLETADPVLEMIRNHQSKLADGIDTICMARLEQVYRADIHASLAKHGEVVAVQSQPYRLDLNYLDNVNEPLTRELRPPKLAMRAVETVSDLALKLSDYLRKDEVIVTTDLTAILYETSTKVAKKGAEPTTVMKLKPEYNVGYAALAVDANYRAPDGTIKAVPVTLTLGIDLLDRNALKRLEDSNPTVTLISWLEAPNVFRYATVIEAGNDKGIWAGVYSNLRIVSEQPTS
jgi:ribonuclease HI